MLKKIQEINGFNSFGFFILQKLADRAVNAFNYFIS